MAHASDRRSVLAPSGGHAKSYAVENPAFTKAGLAGVEANHSSTTPSTENDIGAHSQSDDELQDVTPPQDPNISGMTPTEDTYTFLAGPISAWQENDDYRQFFERGDVAESATTHCGTTVHDGDYDDNSGHAIAIGHVRGIYGTASTDEPAEQSGSFNLGPVIRRRV